MSAWGSGLYSGDLAADLRSTIAAVMLLPFDSERLVEILCETEPDVANNPEDPEHTVFWLVLADQFSKRSMVSRRVQETALTIIDTERDIAVHKNLGMPASDLVKRRKVLAELRARMVSPPAVTKPRKTLKEPQPLLMEVGDLFAFPTFQGQNINPYYKEADWNATGWKADGWGAVLIIDSGRAFDFLAWYRPLTLVDSQPQKPNVVDLLSQVEWILRNPGTISAVHLKRMQFEKLHHIAIDDVRRRKCFPNLTPGTYAALNDISIANELSIGPFHKSSFEVGMLPNGEVFKTIIPTIASLAAITAEM